MVPSQLNHGLLLNNPCSEFIWRSIKTCLYFFFIISQYWDDVGIKSISSMVEDRDLLSSTYYSDVIMSAMAYQITGMSTVWPNVCSGAGQRNSKAPHHLFLWGESTGVRWFPSKRASNREITSIWGRHHYSLPWLLMIFPGDIFQLFIETVKLAFYSSVDWGYPNASNYWYVSISLGNFLARTSRRHQMETFPRFWPFVRGNSPVPGESPTQRPVTRMCDVYFDLSPNNRLSKQSWGW